MLQFLADNIDQLDLALDQLAIRDRNFDRFALMLIDNVVELTLHRYAQDRAAENQFWGRTGEPRHDPKLIERALRQSFDNKAKAARDLGLYDEQLCTTLLNLHSFRNTAYHQGLRHDGILHSLAVFYFINACDLLLFYQPSFWSWSSSDKYSHRARKYIGDIRIGRGESTFHKAYLRLKEVANSLEYKLIHDLSVDMESTIHEVSEMIDFLANDAPERSTRDQVIIDVQAWPFAFTDEAKEFARHNGCTASNVLSLVKWLTHNYKWPVRSDPVASWHDRLDKMRQSNDPHEVLKRYCDFMNQTKTLRAQIEEAASQLDAHIQQLIDEARGK